MQDNLSVCPHCKQQHGRSPREIANSCPSVRRAEYNEAGAVMAIEYQTLRDWLLPLGTPTLGMNFSANSQCISPEQFRQEISYGIADALERGR